MELPDAHPKLGQSSARSINKFGQESLGLGAPGNKRKSEPGDSIQVPGVTSTCVQKSPSSALPVSGKSLRSLQRKKRYDMSKQMIMEKNIFMPASRSGENNSPHLYAEGYRECEFHYRACSRWQGSNSADDLRVPLVSHTFKRLSMMNSQNWK